MASRGPRWLLLASTAILCALVARIVQRNSQPYTVDTTLPFHYDDSEECWRASSSGLVRLNRTLNFGLVYAINMPHRTDRKAALLAMANASGIDLRISDGVRVESREETTTDAFPPYSPADMPLSKLGCYKAHSNVWRTFLDSKEAETALVLEDDVDWDIDVKGIMAHLQSPLGALIGRLSNGTSIQKRSKASTWSEDQWDILRLGTCREPAYRSDFKPDDIRMDALPYVTYADRSVPHHEWIVTDSRMVMDAYGIPMPSVHDEEDSTRYRLIQRSNYPVCLHAYAISRAGASRLLEITSAGLIDGANDLTIAAATQAGLLRSFSVLPPPFGQWKVQGWKGNSDNGGTNLDPLVDEAGPEAFTWNLRNSVRGNHAGNYNM